MRDIHERKLLFLVWKGKLGFKMMKRYLDHLKEISMLTETTQEKSQNYYNH